MNAQSSLLNQLPTVRGRYSVGTDLSKLTWFRVGGPAEVLFKPADVEDLCFFLRNKPAHIPVFVLGVGSNLLVRDGGIPGVVIRLGQGFNNVAVVETSLDVGAAVLDRSIATISCDESIAGLEFLCGIPGTLGGALRMNAGCYGTEIKDVVSMIFAVDSKGGFHKLTPEDMGFSYRHCALPEDWIFVGARLTGRPGKRQEIDAKIQGYLEAREKTQPIKSRTSGSTFANPESAHAWELIDQAGCRGLRIGGAQVSELHCNFLLNTGDATAADIETLGNTVQARVFEKTGVSLRWEIMRVGIQDAQIAFKSEAA